MSTQNQKQPQQNALSIANTQRAIAEVQAAITIAKQFPRDESEAREKILIASARPSLAERAIYTYKKGETEVTGLTIRMAEEIARSWGNIDYGWACIEQRLDESTVETFARDLETNNRRSIKFQVSHRRFTKKGNYLMTDPRDIYETQANQAARRMRACVLGLIPGDILDDARDQCDKTMHDTVEITPETIKALVAAFSALKVTQKQLEKRIQRKIESIQPAQVVQLRKIYNSIKDGMSDRSSWFDDEATAAAPSAPAAKGMAGLKGKLAHIQNGKSKAEPATEAEQTEQAIAEAEIEATGEIVDGEVDDNFDDIPDFAEDQS